MSPDASGESVYTRKGIIPIYRDESLTLRMKEEKPSYHEGFLRCTIFSITI